MWLGDRQISPLLGSLVHFHTIVMGYGGVRQWRLPEGIAAIPLQGDLKRRNSTRPSNVSIIHATIKKLTDYHLTITGLRHCNRKRDAFTTVVRETSATGTRLQQAPFVICFPRDLLIWLGRIWRNYVPIGPCALMPELAVNSDMFRKYSARIASALSLFSSMRKLYVHPK